MKLFMLEIGVRIYVFTQFSIGYKAKHCDCPKECKTLLKLYAVENRSSDSRHYSMALPLALTLFDLVQCYTVISECLKPTAESNKPVWYKANIYRDCIIKL